MRKLWEIAQNIMSDMAEIDQISAKPQRADMRFYAAWPYLQAMRHLNSVDDNYGADNGRSIVAYALSNMANYRGENAKRLKAELKEHLKS